VTMKKAVLFVFLVLSLLCAGCDGDKIEDDVETFLNDSAASKAVNDAVDNASDAVEDYAVEMFDDAIDMTQKLTEDNIPVVQPETSQDIREQVIKGLDSVGQVVLDADTVAKELQECFAMCDFAFKDDSGHKTENNLLCVAQCKGK